jgi:hypothetical protein
LRLEDGLIFLQVCLDVAVDLIAYLEVFVTVVHRVYLLVDAGFIGFSPLGEQSRHTTLPPFAAPAVFAILVRLQLHQCFLLKPTQ